MVIVNRLEEVDVDHDSGDWQFVVDRSSPVFLEAGRRTIADSNTRLTGQLWPVFPVLHSVGDNPEGHLQLGIQNQRQDRQRFRDHHGSPARGGWPVLPKARFVPKSDSQIDWSRPDDRDGLPDGSFQEIITVCPDTR